MNPKTPQPPPQVLLIDLGNVIARFSHQRASQQIADLSGSWATLEQIHDFLFGATGSEGINRSFELGQITPLEFWETAQSRMGLRCPREHFERAWCDIFYLDQEVVAQLRQWYERIPIYLCSNTNPLHWRHVLRLDPKLDELFRKTYLSYELRVRKPDERFFQHVIQDAALTPERCLFIDDLAANVQSAGKLGIQTCQFKSLDELKRAVKL